MWSQRAGAARRRPQEVGGSAPESAQQASIRSQPSKYSITASNLSFRHLIYMMVVEMQPWSADWKRVIIVSSVGGWNVVVLCIYHYNIMYAKSGASHGLRRHCPTDITAVGTPTPRDWFSRTMVRVPALAKQARFSTCRGAFRSACWYEAE